MTTRRSSTTTTTPVRPYNTHPTIQHASDPTTPVRPYNTRSHDSDTPTALSTYRRYLDALHGQLTLSQLLLDALLTL